MESPPLAVGRHRAGPVHHCVPCGGQDLAPAHETAFALRAAGWRSCTGSQCVTTSATGHCQHACQVRALKAVSRPHSSMQILCCSSTVSHAYETKISFTLVLDVSQARGHGTAIVSCKHGDKAAESSCSWWSSGGTSKRKENLIDETPLGLKRVALVTSETHGPLQRRRT